MAQRRMFSKTITNSSSFLMMPTSSRLLYYDLGMNADDDGFCEHFAIMRMTDASPDDLKVLEAKGFIKVFDDKVLVIKDWKENNYLRSDRYTPSKYLEVYEKEIKELNVEPKYTIGIPAVDKVATQVRLGKVSNNISNKEKVRTPLQDAVSLLEKELGVKVPNWGKQARYFKQMTDAGYTVGDIKNTIHAMSNDSYFRQVGSFDLMTVCNNIARFKKLGFKSVQINNKQQPKGDNERMLEKLYATRS